MVEVHVFVLEASAWPDRPYPISRSYYFVRKDKNEVEIVDKKIYKEGGGSIEKAGTWYTIDSARAQWLHLSENLGYTRNHSLEKLYDDS